MPIVGLAAYVHGAYIASRRRAEPSTSPDFSGLTGLHVGDSSPLLKEVIASLAASALTSSTPGTSEASSLWKDRC